MEYDNNEEHPIILEYDNPETAKEDKYQRISGRTRNKPETVDPMWRGKLYAQNTTKKKTVQFYDNEYSLKKDVCNNIMAQSIIRDDIIEY